MSSFMDSMGMVNVDRVTQTFGMTKVQLAETVGLGRETFQKAARQEAQDTGRLPKDQASWT